MIQQWSLHYPWPRNIKKRFWEGWNVCPKLQHRSTPSARLSYHETLLAQLNKIFVSWIRYGNARRDPIKKIMSYSVVALVLLCLVGVAVCRRPKKEESVFDARMRHILTEGDMGWITGRLRPRADAVLVRREPLNTTALKVAPPMHIFPLRVALLQEDGSSQVYDYQRGHDVPFRYKRDSDGLVHVVLEVFRFEYAMLDLQEAYIHSHLLSVRLNSVPDFFNHRPMRAEWHSRYNRQLDLAVKRPTSLDASGYSMHQQFLLVDGSLVAPVYASFQTETGDKLYISLLNAGNETNRCVSYCPTSAMLHVADATGRLSEMPLPQPMPLMSLPQARARNQAWVTSFFHVHDVSSALQHPEKKNAAATTDAEVDERMTLALSAVSSDPMQYVKAATSPWHAMRSIPLDRIKLDWIDGASLELTPQLCLFPLRMAYETEPNKAAVYNFQKDTLPPLRTRDGVYRLLLEVVRFEYLSIDVQNYNVQTFLVFIETIQYPSTLLRRRRMGRVNPFSGAYRYIFPRKEIDISLYKPMGIARLTGYDAVESHRLVYIFCIRYKDAQGEQLVVDVEEEGLERLTTYFSHFPDDIEIEYAHVGLPSETSLWGMSFKLHRMDLHRTDGTFGIGWIQGSFADAVQPVWAKLQHPLTMRCDAETLKQSTYVSLGDAACFQLHVSTRTGKVYFDIRRSTSRDVALMRMLSLDSTVFHCCREGAETTITQPMPT